MILDVTFSEQESILNASFEDNNQTIIVDPAFIDVVTPSASVSKVGNVSTLTVTDKRGVTTTNILDGTKGDKGDKGEKGDKGDPGSGGDLNYVYTQNVPASTWTVTHNLNKYPSVTIVDSADNLVFGDVTYTSANSLNIIFQSAFSGKAYIN